MYGGGECDMFGEYYDERGAGWIEGGDYDPAAGRAGGAGGETMHVVAVGHGAEGAGDADVAEASSIGLSGDTGLGRRGHSTATVHPGQFR